MFMGQLKDLTKLSLMTATIKKNGDQTDNKDLKAWNVYTKDKCW